MTFRPVAFAEGAYADDAKPFTSQECVGFLPVNAEMPGTRSPSMLRMVPGLREVAVLPGVSRQRGARNVEGKLYIVGDTSLFQLFPTFGASVLGSIPGIGRIIASHNQIAQGNQLCLATGPSGYVWNTVDSSLTRITDPAFPGAVCVDYIGGIFVGVEPQKRYAFNSAIGDGLSYNGLETFQGESKPDRIVRCVEYNGELVLLSEASIERFDYLGQTNEIFRNKKIFGMRGCAATHAVDKLDEALFFIGDDGSGYELRGYEAKRITSHAIEQAWRECDLSKAFSFTWEDRGHKVWYVTFPDGHTWGFDCATRKWHRRVSHGLNRWRLAWLVKWQGQWYGGDYNSGRIFVLDWDYAMEGSDPLIREVEGGVLHNTGNPIRGNALQLEFDVGPQGVYVAGASLLLEGDLPDGAVNDESSGAYTATGTGPMAFSIIGALPPGVDVNSDGEWSGTFTTAGEYTWTVKVTDANGVSTWLVDHCTVVADEMVLAGDLLGGVVGDVEAGAYTQTGGAEPVTYAITDGTITPGITLAPDGTYSGTRTTAGTHSWTVTATDTNGLTATLDDSSVTVAALVETTLVMMAVGEGGAIATRDSLGAWTTRTSGVSNDLNGAAIGQTAHVVVGSKVGSGLILRSANFGASWSSRTTNVTCANLHGVDTDGDGLFVAVGGPSGTADGQITRSTDDGLTWAAVTVPAGCGPLRAVCYAAELDIWVATSSTGKALYSLDGGVTWTKVAVSSSSLVGVTYNPTADLFMAVGNNGNTYTSPTGATWTFKSAGAVGGGFNGVTCVGARFVAAAQGVGALPGIYITDDNGATWTKQETTANAYAACMADDVVAVGVSGGSVWTSDDSADTFTEEDGLAGQSCRGIAGRLITV